MYKNCIIAFLLILIISSTLEQELVETMNTQFYRDHKPESPSFQALLPSLEGTTNID